MKVSLFEPFFSGSHATWATGLQEKSTLDIRIHRLDGKNWKWRLHTASLSYSQLNSEAFDVDCLLCSDMMDVPYLVAAKRNEIANTPILTYFHENQLSYPWSVRDRHRARDRFHYGLTNIKSALVSDHCIFNSAYHRENFLEEARQLLQEAPDYREDMQIDHLEQRSSVLPIGIDFSIFEQERKQPQSTLSELPTILWNHRWEHDKNAALFFRILKQLKDEGLRFSLIVVGEEQNAEPTEFVKAKEDFHDELLHWGYAETRQEYAQLLLQADILPVTSKHDFFGISVVEAIYAGCYPVLPNQLAYPEHIPANLHHQHLYHDQEELTEKLRNLLTTEAYAPSLALREHVATYSWAQVAPRYDELIRSLA